MIFKKVEKVVGLQQPAGRDYVQSKEYSSKLLNQVSKVWEILTRRNSTENFRFWNRSAETNLSQISDRYLQLLFQAWNGLIWRKDTGYEWSSDWRRSLEEYLLWHGNWNPVTGMGTGIQLLDSFRSWNLLSESL